MVFNSPAYLVFFPIVVLIYYLIPCRVRYIWLLAASYFFYMQWNAVYGLLLLYSTAVAYAAGLLLDRIQGSRGRKLCLGTCLLMGFAPLVYFKYTGFILESLNRLFMIIKPDTGFAVPDILLPVGISFFTFQAAGYVMDVYRKSVPAERNFFRFALFVSFFPQLVAGPIERTGNLLSQLDCNVRFDFEKARDGLWLMLWGYFMKVVIADRIAIFADTVYGSFRTYDGTYLLVAALLFPFQIYCDFAGYSTIAIGSAKILGIRLMDNFSSPYLSMTVTDYWRRWHISLTSWFRDYVYIPLGGNRKGKLRTYFNRLIVFILSGLWHGANWTFVMWGALNGLMVVLEDASGSLRKKLSGLPYLKSSSASVKAVRIFFTFIIISLLYIPFRAETLSDTLAIFSDLSHFPRLENINILFGDGLYECGLDAKNFHLLILMTALLLIIDMCSMKGIVIREKIAAQSLWFRSLFTAFAVIFLLIFGIWGGSYDKTSFIYFQF